MLASWRLLETVRELLSTRVDLLISMNTVHEVRSDSLGARQLKDEADQKVGTEQASSKTEISDFDALTHAKRDLRLCIPS